VTVLLLPVKSPARAKSRLDLPDPGIRAGLVRAFARDVTEAALACAAVDRVYVVTDDADLALPGTTRLADEGAGDLNDALRLAASRVRRHDPAAGLAALCADVPCLLPADLDAALTAAPADRWFVADAAGTGTTLLVAAPGVELDPHFGVGSAAAHAASGAVSLTGALATLRLDVDTAADLEQARALGTGAHTSALLSAVPR